MRDYVGDNALLSRDKGETDEEYKIRLCVLKLDQEVDVSWNTLVEILELDCSADHLRKTAYGMKEAHDVYKSKMFEGKIVGKHILEDIEAERKRLEEAKLEFESEKMKVQSLRIDPRRVVRENSRSELYLEELMNSVRNTMKPEKMELPARKRGSKEMIVTVADIHYGKEINIQSPSGEVMNRYNTEIFQERMWTLLAEIKELVWEERVQHVHLFNLSDSIDGILRKSQLQSLNAGITDGVIEFSKFMILWLKELLKVVDVDYYSSLGNHNEIRPLGSNSGDFPHENTEYIITAMIEVAFEDYDNITIHECKNFNYVEVANHKILATHGQNDRNLTNSIKDYKLMFDMDIDILMTGHLHSSHEETIGATMSGNVEYIQVPSICGTDDYAVKIKKNAKAGSKILVLDSEKNMKTTYDIILN